MAMPGENVIWQYIFIQYYIVEYFARIDLVPGIIGFFLDY